MRADPSFTYSRSRRGPARRPSACRRLRAMW
jgi:hypothetical protein